MSRFVAGGLLMAALAVPAVRAQTAEAAKRAPGVLVRLYQIGGDMQSLPEIMPGELPNEVRILPTVDIKEGEFGLSDRFVTQVDAFIRIDQADNYTFRLTSDDGSRMWIDDRMVIDHDGLHGAEPKGAGTYLSAGERQLRIRHFDNTGGELLKLEWRAPGDSEFRPIPPEILTHDAGLTRTTAPGNKRLIPALRRGLPGDGRPVAGFHPAETRFRMRSVTRTEERADWIVSGRVRTGHGASARTSKPLVGWIFPERVGPINQTINEITSEPYEGHLLFVAGSEVFRLALDETDGVLQGCAVRFSNLGPEAVRTEPRDAVFEILGIRGRTNGLEIEFTQPLDARVGWEAEGYQVEQWPFQAETEKLPKRDGAVYPVKSASVSEDRRRVFLEIDGLKAGHVVYVRVLPPCISESGEKLWATEAWYTLNTIPQKQSGQVRARPAQPQQNVLSAQEQAQGWRLLFDGRTTQGWRGFGKESMPVGPDNRPGWEVIDGCLVRTGPGGDIITVDQFGSFELSLEWRVCAGGNSGIFYRVAEQPDFQWVWQTGPEMQVLDNSEHRDGQKSLTSAGANYALYAPEKDATRAVGLFNEARIVVRGQRVEHWLNGEKLLEYELGGEDWKQRVASSKFAQMPAYGTMARGHIALQDHGDRVWYRNIKIRELKPGADE